MFHFIVVAGLAAIAASPAPASAQLADNAESAAASKQPRAHTLRPGRHRCQLSAEYRFRPCTVTANGPGRYRFSFPNGLMSIEGELVRRGSTLVFTGRISDDEPFICSSPERHLPDYAGLAAECRRQPLQAILRRQRNGWVGRLSGLRELRAVYANDRPAGERQRPLSHRLAPYSQAGLPLTILH
jgi:hypothetical protein